MKNRLLFGKNYKYSAEKCKKLLLIAMENTDLGSTEDRTGKSTSADADGKDTVPVPKIDEAVGVLKELHDDLILLKNKRNSYEEKRDIEREEAANRKEMESTDQRNPLTE